ncbi:hypothetical protein SAMN06296036_11982 [Pseudobacteriovorax antillogorgiicola]|uniref:Uncharacterized protein n=1 Tax=Pseudobacteriovorax antillogorgiicola TaxID=1513793 RepID=A0A1Y6CE88_9BACT|nr:hypothetical protein EDD56_11981 [Pseudobacteriovorax antillogorgiicola]SMF58224.1 hypothetical protein SAMN06296036_11982 [Pseudobacteriovorax antillogorgiicola]
MPILQKEIDRIIEPASIRVSFCWRLLLSHNDRTSAQCDQVEAVQENSRLKDRLKSEPNPQKSFDSNLASECHKPDIYQGTHSQSKSGPRLNKKLGNQK